MNYECIREVANLSHVQNFHKFDNKAFNPKSFKKDISTFSPKLEALLNNIEQLDQADQAKYGKHFKHFIFSDPAKGYGAKFIASGLIAFGYSLVYSKVGSSLVINKNLIKKSNDKKFALLSSTPVFSIPITQGLKKEILTLYNERPTNVHGDNFRFIVLDSGYKEGIDLFDVKYVHIFEPQTSIANKKQAIGRATRTCGQKGLEFHPKSGWPLKVYIYDTSVSKNINEKFSVSTLHQLFALGLDMRREVLSQQLEKVCMIGSVDYELNKNIHEFKIEEDDDEPIYRLTWSEGGNLPVLGDSPSKPSSTPNKPVLGDSPSKPSSIPNKPVLGDSPSKPSSTPNKPVLGDSPSKPSSTTPNKPVLGDSPNKQPSYNKPIFSETPTKPLLRNTPIKQPISSETPNENASISSECIVHKCGLRPTKSFPVKTSTLLFAYLSINPEKVTVSRKNLCSLMTEDPIFCKKVWEAHHDLPSFIQKNLDNIKTNLSGLRYRVRYQLQKILKPYLKSPSPVFDAKMPFMRKRQMIAKKFGRYAWPKVKLENHCLPSSSGKTEFKFTPTQDFVRHYFTPASEEKGILLQHSVGTGKCHAKDTPILMYDGTIKMVQDINVGDTLMGDDSTPRKVLSLANGIDDMYDIIPVKGDKYTVNSEHILVLKYNSIGITYNKRQPNKPYRADYFDNNKIRKLAKSFETREEAELFLKQYDSENSRTVEIEVKDFLNLSKSMQKELKGVRKGVEFRHNKELPLDPYLIGIWLGDGTSRNPKFTTADKEILDYMIKETERYGLKVVHEKNYDYRIVGNGKKGGNYINNILSNLNLLNNKHIPQEYLTASRENRLKLIAGLIDTDGYYDKKGNSYEIIQKSDEIANGLLFLARSLGFAAYSKRCEKSCIYKGEQKTGVYNRIQISGNIEEIPVLLERKKARKRKQKKDVLVTGIKVFPMGKGEYFGFTIDGNNRYLLGDFTVTHNTCTAIATATTSFEPKGYTILWVTRATLKSDMWKNMFGQICNVILKEKIEKRGLKLPSDLSSQKKLLSKSWQIQPLSYKQFTNLITGKNQFYQQLVAINGSEDPLKKTLLIIDEAHKLHGGDDLLATERPDVEKLTEMIHKSYRISGKDSVKVMLMTATPFTNDPLELIKLLNLCREDPLPENFDEFSKRFLDEDGTFSKRGKLDFLNSITGYISYLNRELDARQFAQPFIHYVDVPMSVKQLSNVGSVKDLSSKYKQLREKIKTDIQELEKKKKELMEAIKETKKEKTKKEKECKTAPKEDKALCRQELVKIEELIREKTMELEKQRLEIIKEIGDLTQKSSGLRTEQKKDRMTFENDFSQEKMLFEKCKIKPKSSNST